MEEHVVLVDEQDNPIGEGGKMQVHREATLHRSFSIFVFNDKAETLLQQRAEGKYHSGGLWSNACCGHPRPGEETIAAGQRRLQEEFGFSCNLKELLQFTYKVQLDHGLWEHEYDHVLIGTYNGEVLPNPEEIQRYKWVSKQELLEDMKHYPKQYTEWFKIVIDRVVAAW